MPAEQEYDASEEKRHGELKCEGGDSGHPNVAQRTESGSRPDSQTRQKQHQRDQLADERFYRTSYRGEENACQKAKRKHQPGVPACKRKDFSDCVHVAHLRSAF
jgi:FtsZ-interacting cell division protein YlmF